LAIQYAEHSNQKPAVFFQDFGDFILTITVGCALSGQVKTSPLRFPPHDKSANFFRAYPNRLLQQQATATKAGAIVVSASVALLLF